MHEQMLEWIRQRRSCRRYQARPLEREKIEAVVEAGRYAPSGGNSQSCHFLVIENRQVLDQLAVKAREAFAGMEVTEGLYPSLAASIRLSREGAYEFHYHAPVLILTANKKSYPNRIADCACALENMMLMADALDLGSCWINQLRWLNEEESLLSIERSLGLGEEERIYGALALGYPDTPDGLPLRTPLKRTGFPVSWID